VALLLRSSGNMSSKKTDSTNCISPKGGGYEDKS
jgi:hypothetical protein